MSHCSSWFRGLECQNHSNVSGQKGGNSHSEHNPKGDLSETAGGCVGMADEEQGAEEAQEEGNEHDIAESPVIGLDCEDVSVLHKQPQNHRCDDDREAETHRLGPSPKNPRRPGR